MLNIIIVAAFDGCWDNFSNNSVEVCISLEVYFFTFLTFFLGGYFSKFAEQINGGSY